MSSLKKIGFIFIAALPLAGRSNAQHISRAMDFANPVIESDSNTLSLAYSNLFYLRDYEYFNPIQTGYTLFGTWHYPRLALQPNKWLRLEAGALLQKEFGDKQLDNAWPVFSLQLQHKNFRFLFGALEGNQSHRLAEPMMSYDKLFERPIEEGLQIKYKSKRISADAWLDWELRQKENDDNLEELTGGISFSYLLTNPGKPWKVSIPVQCITPHKGGQLDTISASASTVINASAGLVGEWNNPDSKKWMQQTRFDIFFHDYNGPDNIYAYNKGSGFQSDFYLRSEWNLAFLATYWKGSNYIAPKGAPLYQSISSLPGSDYKEPERQLLFLNLLFEKELFPGFFMDARYSPYIDLQNELFEHSFLVLLSYRGNFRLSKLK